MASQEISVRFDPALLAFIEAAAAREDRSLSSLIRHYVAETARRKGWPKEILTPLPVRPVLNTPEALAEAKDKFAGLERERDQLLSNRKRLRERFMGEDRLAHVQHELAALGSEIRVASAMELAR